MKLNQLPILSCDNCGVCCLHVGHPRYFWEPDLPGKPDEYWSLVPADLKSELLAYFERVGESDLGQPCIWFDETTRRCRHHEIRPQFCRDFEMGGTNCRRMRIDHGISDSGR